MSRLLTFFKNWALPISIVAGVMAYLVFYWLPFSPAVRAAAAQTVSLVQPALIFVMLFLSFCRIDLRQARLRLWHLWLLLFQVGSFVLLALVVRWSACSDNVRLLLESAMLCLICPTATAAVVVTDKLGGNMAVTLAYTMMINLVTAVATSLFIPMLYPDSGIDFVTSFGIIIAKVFSVLVVPLLLAALVRYTMPRLHAVIVKPKDLAFYLWMVALALALAVTTRSIVHSTVPVIYIVGIGVVSLLCCLLQFAFGRTLGAGHGDRITAGQALGQKNTIFIIWMACTFMNPVTALAGGLYSVWHNLVNAYQLYERRVGKI